MHHLLILVTSLLLSTVWCSPLPNDQYTNDSVDVPSKQVPSLPLQDDKNIKLDPLVQISVNNFEDPSYKENTEEDVNPLTTNKNEDDPIPTDSSKDLMGQETFYPGVWWGVRPWGGWGGWGGFRPGWHGWQGGWHGWHNPHWGGHWGGNWGGNWGHLGGGRWGGRR